jgi:hypothetical protein
MEVQPLKIKGPRTLSLKASRPMKKPVPKYAAIPPDAIKVPLPDVQQPDDDSCGAASLMAIFAYYGLGPEDFESFEKEVHTNKKTGTIIYDMIRYAATPSGAGSK